MRNRLHILGLGAAAILFAACGPSTTLKTSWKDPTVTEPIQFTKVLALMVEKDGATRRRVEDMIVERVQARRPGLTAVPSYTILSGDDITDKVRSREIVKEAGIDGAVVLRVVGVDQQTTYVPGSYPQPYYNFYGYYDWAWPAVYDPGYLQTDTIVNLETLIYSVKDDKLLWSGVTETFNPSSTEDLLDGAAQCVTSALKEEGVIQ